MLDVGTRFGRDRGHAGARNARRCVYGDGSLACGAAMSRAGMRQRSEARVELVGVRSGLCARATDRSIVLVSNPPYVPRSAMSRFCSARCATGSLALALFGGTDGLGDLSSG